MSFREVAFGQPFPRRLEEVLPKPWASGQCGRCSGSYGRACNFARLRGWPEGFWALPNISQPSGGNDSITNKPLFTSSHVFRAQFLVTHNKFSNRKKPSATPPSQVVIEIIYVLGFREGLWHLLGLVLCAFCISANFVGLAVLPGQVCPELMKSPSWFKSVWWNPHLR